MSNNRVNWDPGTFRLVSHNGTLPRAVTRRGRRISSIHGKFVAGPVDVDWLSQARKFGVTTLWVGLFLWFLRGLKRSNSFIVSNLMIQEWGVQPDAKSRALRKLEKAGLITIELRGKRNPLVTLIVKRTTPTT
jgi:hypothetical protein